MRLARKLLLLAATTAMTLALTASSASAVVEVTPEVPPGASCGTWILLAGHVVSGGCHVEFNSTANGMPMHAYVPAKTTLSNCSVNLEGRVEVGGEGYFTEMVLTPPSGGAVPCTRAACDEVNGTQLPWPFHVEENGPGNEEVEMTLCLRTVASGPGGTGTQCEIHLRLVEIANHWYEVGVANAFGTERFCENNPPNPTSHPSLAFPVSVEAHFVTSGTERIEINH